jgi:hypothetical protein
VFARAADVPASNTTAHAARTTAIRLMIDLLPNPPDAAQRVTSERQVIGRRR